MKLEDELLDIIREVAVLKVVAVKLGDSIDRIDGEQHGTRETLHALVREVEKDVKNIEVKLAAVRERLGMDKDDVVMGDKVQITGADIKGSQVGTGGQNRNGGADWVKVLIWAAALLAVIALAGAMGMSIKSQWFSVEPPA